MRFDPGNLVLFVAVARAGSFSAASATLGVPPSTTSRRIAQLERSLGVRLIHRSTRSLSLTDAGRRYYESATAIVDAIEQANRAVTQARQEVSGRLRLTAPHLVGGLKVIDWVLAFRKKFPGVVIELRLDNHLLDLPATGFDLAFRAGTLSDSTLVARPLFEVPWAAVAAPTALPDPAPSEPDDLVNLDAVTSSVEPGQVSWTFRRDGQVRRVRPRGVLHFNDLELARRAVLAGHGIGMLPQLLVEADVRAGRLRQMLPDWQGPCPTVYLVYHDRELQTLAQRTFIDFVVDQCRTLP